MSEAHAAARLGQPSTDPAPIRWLRISYWTGAIVDALAGIQLLWPSLLASELGLAEPSSPGFRYARGMAAALMLGWTGLLVWADRSPLERRGVLGLTIGVVLGLAVNEAVAVNVGFLPVGPAAAIWALQAILTALFGWSLVAARRPGAAWQR